MRKSFIPIICICTIFLSSCTIKESIVFNEDGSGSYLISYDMGYAMKKMAEGMGGASSEDKKDGKVMDTTVVFSEIMETYKDSVANLSEDKKHALEAVKDMYMTMRVDEANEEMKFGIGMDFKSIDELKDINEKIKKAKSLNSKNDQVGAMKESSPLGKFMGNDDNSVQYTFNETGFTRTTIVTEADKEALDEPNSDEGDEMDNEFISYFEEASYIITYKFPKAVKSTSLENVEFSEDRKTITYKTDWMNFLKNPNSLDIKVEFVNE